MESLVERARRYGLMNVRFEESGGFLVLRGERQGARCEIVVAGPSQTLRFRDMLDRWVQRCTKDAAGER